LIIDDTPENCEALAMNLDALGMSSESRIVAYSIDKGLEAIQEFPSIRTILLDLRLPGIKMGEVVGKVQEVLELCGNTKAVIIPISVGSTNPSVVNTTEIANSITGPKALSKVLQIADNHVEQNISREDREDIRGGATRLEGKVEKLETMLLASKEETRDLKLELKEVKAVLLALKVVVDDPLLLWKLILRHPAIQGAVIAIVITNTDSMIGVWQKYRHLWNSGAKNTSHLSRNVVAQSFKEPTVFKFNDQKPNLTIYRSNSTFLQGSINNGDWRNPTSPLSSRDLGWINKDKASVGQEYPNLSTTLSTGCHVFIGYLGSNERKQSISITYESCFRAWGYRPHLIYDTDGSSPVLGANGDLKA